MVKVNFGAEISSILVILWDIHQAHLVPVRDLLVDKQDRELGCEDTTEQQPKNWDSLTISKSIDSGRMKNVGNVGQ